MIDLRGLVQYRYMERCRKLWIRQRVMLAIGSAMYAACKLCKSHNSALFDAKSENPVEPKSKKTFRYQGSNVKGTLDDE